jgi:hypothetical protein
LYNPEFTLKFVPASYAVTTTNPYTGTSITQQYENNTIELSITNQQYSYSNGSSFQVYYNVRTKGHFEQDWTELYPTTKLPPTYEAYKHSNYQDYYSEYITATPENPRNNQPSLPQSDSTHTVITLPAPASNGQVDFQVEAMIGHNSTWFDPTNNIVYDPANGGVNRPAIAFDISSDWSNTQTISMPDGSVSISTSPNPTPSATPVTPEFSSWTILLMLSIMVIAGLLVYFKKSKHYS